MAKIKLKTHSGAAKRFKPTKSGFKHRHACRSHLMTGMSNSRKRRLRAHAGVSAADVHRVTRMLQH